MFEITGYYLAHDDNAELLTEKVQELVKQGWQPFGGISTVLLGRNPSYAQAMVKYGRQMDE